MKRIDSVIAKGPYKDDWTSLSKNGVPEWFSEAKFGIFIHWGVFTSEEFMNEWYPRNLYIEGSEEYKHHVEKYGPLSESGYIDYIDRFKAENFNPDEWLDVFKKSGAKYVIPVGEHHDGFQMYKSKASHWNAFEKGPRKDIDALLEESAKKHGIRFGISSHRFEHWWFLGNGRKFESDIKGEFKRGDFYWPSYPEPADHNDFDFKPAPSEEFMQDWLLRVCEMVDKFLPEVIYFDWWIGQSALKPYLKKAAAYYYNVMQSKGLKGIIAAKSDAFAPGSYVRDIERGGLSGSAAYVWQSDTPICRQSWGYVKNADYKGASEVVRELVDIVSKNGNLLLNVGPKADGTLCDEEKEVLLGIGKWLDDNGEMIFGSTPYKIYGEGSVNRQEGGFKDGEVLDYTSEDFRFTEKDGHIYVAAMKPSTDGHYFIKSMAKKGEDGGSSYKGIISKVVLLSGDEEVKWDHLDNGLDIRTDHVFEDDMPVVFRIEIK
ncbi:MAG: alpha-L-fucosidase [Lachnospiraceae bacterium]|nr:alpha-L-fucosidase [Lachnospiraceae bacterium]